MSRTHIFSSLFIHSTPNTTKSSITTFLDKLVPAMAEAVKYTIDDHEIITIYQKDGKKTNLSIVESRRKTVQ